MASGYTSQISVSYLGAKIRFYYTTSYNASNNTSTVSLRPLLYTATNTGSPGCNGYKGNVYGNGNSIYAMDNAYAGSHTLRAGGTYNSETWFDPHTGSLSSFTVAHDSSGNASFNAGYYGKLRANIDGTETDINSVTGCSATFHENAPYAISYNANGGTGAPAAQGVYAGVSYAISTGAPTRTGCTFLGWSTSSTASTPTYVGGNVVTPNGNLALYAVWSYTVTCEDRIGNSSGTLLGSATTVKSRGASVSGADWGSNATYSQYYTGYYYTGCTSATVNNVITVYRYFAVNTYPLSVTKSDNGITVNISRQTSPYGGGSIGLLANGATLYYGDTLTVSWSVQSGYMEDTLTVNSVDVSAETPPYPVTVSSSVTVVMTVKLGAIVYIANDLYQAFVYDGANWVQYEAYIYNGSSWDAY